MDFLDNIHFGFTFGSKEHGSENSHKRPRDSGSDLGFSDSSPESDQNLKRIHPVKKTKPIKKYISAEERDAFFNLLEHDNIKNFLRSDVCLRISDNYLVATVFAYFKRGSFDVLEYTELNFFAALYLANDMEEDEEEYKYEIFPWAFGRRWKTRYMDLLNRRDSIWARCDHRAVVSQLTCAEIMSCAGPHWAWQRKRPDYHGGAVRAYSKEPEDDGHPRGPHCTPRACHKCAPEQEVDSGLPMTDLAWYLSSASDQSDSEDGGGDAKVVKFVPRVISDNRNFKKPTAVPQPTVTSSSAFTQHAPRAPLTTLPQRRHLAPHPTQFSADPRGHAVLLPMPGPMIHASLAMQPCMMPYGYVPAMPTMHNYGKCAYITEE